MINRTHGIILLSAVLALLFSYYRAQDRNQSSYHIGILLPVTHDALHEIVAGFKENLHLDKPIKYDLYNAQGDRVLMHRLAEQMVSKQYDLMVTVATQPTLLMKEICAQRSCQTPVVGLAISNLSSQGLPTANIAVVADDEHTDRFVPQLEFMLKYVPELRKLLLVYAPNGMLDAQKELLADSCKQKNIELSTLPILQVSELGTKVPAQLPFVDAVIILKDNTICSGIETLINSCAHAHKPLCVSDLNSGLKGAQLAYGVREYDYGAQGAQLAHAILEDHISPQDLAPRIVNNYQEVYHA